MCERELKRDGVYALVYVSVCTCVRACVWLMLSCMVDTFDVYVSGCW